MAFGFFWLVYGHAAPLIQPGLRGIEMYRIFVVFLAVVVSGCVYPTKKGTTYGIHIDYEKIQTSVICKIIDAWWFEYDYHKRKLPLDATAWYVTVKLEHNRIGGFGMANTGSKTSYHHDWTKVLNAGVSPSRSDDYGIVANLEQNIPKDFFRITNAETGEELVEFDRYKDIDVAINLDPDKINCSENYIDLSLIGLVEHFSNYVEGFNKEVYRDPRRYTNLKYVGSGEIAASIGGKFTYMLMPYSTVLPPSVSYTDKIKIDVLVTRIPYWPKYSPPLISAANVQQLACFIKFPDSIELAKACYLGKPKVVTFKSIAGREKLLVKPTEEPATGFRPDTFRELNNQILREAVEEIQ